MNDCAPKNPESVSGLFSGTPENRQWGCPDLSWQSSPIAIGAVFTNILKQYFSDATRFTNGELRALIEARKPLVTTLDQADASQTGRLPQIAVTFVSSEPEEKPFGRNNQIDYNMRNSTGTFFTMWSIQHHVEILAKSRREAALLGEAVCMLFHHFRTTIQQMLEAHAVHVVKFQGPQLVKEDGNYLASVDLLTRTLDKWYLAEAAPRLKRIHHNLQEK